MLKENSIDFEFSFLKLFGTGQKSFARGHFWPVPKNPLFF